MTDLLFNFDGRISRTGYWRAWLAQLILGVVLFFVILLTSLIPYLAIVLLLIAAVLMLNSYIAVGAKRLHDRGKSGWWLLLFFLVPAILKTIGEVEGSSEWLCDAVAFAIFVWMIVELGCLRGTTGPNQYGPDPLALVRSG